MVLWHEKYFRITFSKITTFFFLFSFLYCLIHSLVQSFLYSYDHQADRMASSVVREADVPQNEVSWLTRSDGIYTLKLCKHVPLTDTNARDCKVIFRSGNNSLSIPPGYRREVKVLQFFPVLLLGIDSRVFHSLINQILVLSWSLQTWLRRVLEY